MRNSTARSATSRRALRNRRSPAALPGRLAEVLAVGQHGRHRTPGAARRLRGPAAGLAVAGQLIQHQPRRGTEHDPGPGARARFPRARAARAASWQDRHALAAPIGCCRPHQGQVPAGWAQRNSRAGPAQPGDQPGQVPAVPAGAGDLAGSGVAAAAAARPQPRDLLAAVPARPGPRRRPGACTARTGRRTRPGAARRSRGKQRCWCATAGNSGRTTQRQGACGSARSRRRAAPRAGRGRSTACTDQAWHGPARSPRRRCR